MNGCVNRKSQWSFCQSRGFAETCSPTLQLTNMVHGRTDGNATKKTRLQHKSVLSNSDGNPQAPLRLPIQFEYIHVAAAPRHPSAYTIYALYCFDRARPTLLVPKSYTEYHFLKKASPRMARGPAGSGMSMPKNDDIHEPCTSSM